MKNEYGSQPIEPPPSDLHAVRHSRDRRAVRRPERDAAHDAERRERDDERVRDRARARRPRRWPSRRRHRGEDRQDHEHGRMDVQEDDRADHRREGDRRADGEVDAARDDHEQLAEREQRDDGGLREDVADVPAGEEDRCRQADPDHEEEQDQRRAEAKRQQPDPERAEPQAATADLGGGLSNVSRAASAPHERDPACSTSAAPTCRHAEISSCHQTAPSGNAYSASDSGWISML